MKINQIVFAPLALNQSEFFIELAKSFKLQGIESSFISFHQTSSDKIKKLGFKCFDYYEELSKNKKIFSDDELSKIFDAFSVTNPMLMVSHEIAAYEERNIDFLLQKFANSLNVADKIIKQIVKNNSQTIICQELGGFVSVISVLLAARKNNIENLFLEPSFFRGRIFITKNSIYAPVINSSNKEQTEEFKKYLENTLSEKKIVIPKKDIGHYRSVLKKILNFHNITRLFQKLYEKYILKKQEEFNHIGQYVRKHLRMYVNSVKLKKIYVQIPKKKFIYYPLHVPADVALTIRSPKYMDQFTLIDYIARNLPVGFDLVIKEHPAQVGAVDFYRVKDLLNRYNNIKFLNPFMNNLELISKCDLIVTVNSKSGAEAHLLGKKVIVLGDAFYKDCEQISRCVDISTLKEAIESTLVKPVSSKDQIREYFAQVWNNTYPGEIFDTKKENIETFKNSILSCLKNI